MFQYADDGPPTGTPLFAPEYWTPAAIGWLVTKESDTDSLASHTATYSDGTFIKDTAIFGGIVPHISQRLIVENAETVPAQADRDALMIAAAREIGADILVTTRDSLLRVRGSGFAETITIASPGEAIPLLGLFIRSRGEFFATKTARVAFTFNRGLYWQRATELYVPSLLDFVARTYQLGETRGSRTLGLLAFAVKRRLARVFERRDGIWRLINQQQDLDIAEDTLAEVDALLTFLMSAWDALAKVADGVLQAETVPAQIGWQRNDWLKKIRGKDPKLALLFDSSAQPHRALKALRLLRNCIHDEGLDAAVVQAKSRTHETWLVLPSLQAAAIVQAMSDLEPLAVWGVHDGPEGSRLVEVGSLVETLLLGTFAGLDSVIQRLGEILALMTTAPELGPESQVNEALLSRHIQWQIGLGEPWPAI